MLLIRPRAAGEGDRPKLAQRAKGGGGGVEARAPPTALRIADALRRGVFTQRRPEAAYAPSPLRGEG